MKTTFMFTFGLLVCGCGFKFALGENPYGAPLAPLVIKDRGGQGVGESLKRHLGSALARSGLTRGKGQPRRLTVHVAPWERTTLYNTIDGRAVVFGEQFSLLLTAQVAGRSRPVRLTEVVTLAPDRGLQGRALNLQRVADAFGLKLAARLAEALE